MTNTQDSIYSEIGKRIRLAREQTGLTQTDLALTIGLTRTSIVNIEGGHQHYTIDRLYMIAAALGTEVYELLPEMPANLDTIQEGDYTPTSRKCDRMGG